MATAIVVVADGVGVAVVEDNGKAEVVVGARGALRAVVDAVVCREVFLVRTGAVVFHWWVEKGLVMLAGRVTSWSPTVDRRDSGTVGRSQAGRLLTDSSAGEKTFDYLRFNDHLFSFHLQANPLKISNPTMNTSN